MGIKNIPEILKPNINYILRYGVNPKSNNFIDCLLYLYNNVNNYIGKSIQFIVKPKNIGHNECVHNIMWQCKFGGIFRPNNFNSQTKGIMAIHKGHINRNIYSTCSCEHERQELDSENTFTYFTEKYHHVYPHSIRVLE